MRKIVMVIMCLFLILPNILEGTAKASTTVKSTSDQTYINKAQDLPAPSPTPPDLVDFSTDSGPQPTPTTRPENSASKAALNENDLSTDEVVSVSTDVYDQIDQGTLIILKLKTKTLQKQGQLDAVRAGKSLSKQTLSRSEGNKLSDLSESEIKQLAEAGASKVDVYWINYLTIGQSHLTPLEFWKWKQEKELSWEEIEQELEKDVEIIDRPSVKDDVYADNPAIFSERQSVTSSVYESGEYSALAANTINAFDAASSSVFNDLIVHSQINQIQKPQYNDSNNSSEVVDPVSGSLTRKENLIHLPGVDGLDLDVGLMYDSNQGVPFISYVFWNSYWQMWDRSYSYSTPPMSIGWSFQFPSMQYVSDQGMFYHDGKGNTYKVGSIDGLSNYTGLINYKGKDKRFVSETWNQGQFSNGQIQSSSYIEYSDFKREYFSANGDLIGIVDRFNNTITFKYENAGKLSSITDTMGRVIQFSYEDNLYDGDVVIRVFDGENEVQKVVLTKESVIASIPNGDYVAPLQIRIPVLSQITKQNGEKTYFNYQNEVALYSHYGYMFNSLLKEVKHPRSTTKYEYTWVNRHIGEYESVREFQVASRGDYTGSNAYQQIKYSYNGDYAGNAPTQYPGHLPDDFRFSTASAVVSNTASNNLQTTNTFDKDGRVLRTETREAGGERKVTENTAFHGVFTQSPIRTTISEYAAQDSEATANHLYTETVWNDWGLLQSQTEPLSGEQFNNPGIKQHYTTTYQYEPKYRFLETKSWYQNESDPAPLIERYTYTDKGRLSTVTNASGEQTTYSYGNRDTLGGISQMTAEKTAKGQLVAKSVTIYGPESRYAYPTEQQQWFNIGKSDQKIVKTKMSYEMGTGLLKSQSDGNDQTTVYEYDAAGRLKKETHPIRTNSNGETFREVIDYNYYHQTSSNFDSVNAGTYVLKVDTIKTVTQLSTNSSMRTYANTLYNGMGLALLEEHYDDNVSQWVFTQYHYDDQGQAIYQKDALGNEITASYDAWGRQNRATDANNNIYVTDHNLKQRKTESYMIAADTQERLNYLETIYDPWGQPVTMKTYKDWPSQSQPLTESYRYDISGNVIGYTDPANHLNDAGITTSYSYDALNRLTSVYDALNQRTRYTYDGIGQLAKVTVQAKGGTEQILNTKYYNEVGLLTSKLDGASQSESLSYNALGQLTSKTDRNGSLFGYSYDEIGALKSSTVSGMINNVSQTQKTELIYNDGSPSYQTTKNYLNGTIQAMQRNTVNSLNQVRSTNTVAYSAGAVAHSAYIFNQRDALGRITQLNDYYLNFYVNYQFNKLRLDKVQTNGSATVNSAATANVQYSYTGDDLVKSISYPTLTDGSILMTVYTYNKALNWVESVTNQKGGSVLSKYVYGYDNNGNITSITETKNNGVTQNTQTTTYGYDALNRLISTVRPGGSRDAYTYDVRGNRLTMEQSVSSPAEFQDTSYSYDLWNTLTSVTKNGSTTSFQYYADGLRYLKSTGSSHTQVNYDNNAQVLTEEKLSGNSIVQQSTFVRGDRVLVKKDKTASKDYYYLYNGHGDVVQIVDTSGKTVNEYSYDEWGNITSQTEGISNSFKYAGEVYDAETGLYYLRARYYDPSMGRFLNEDTYEGQINNPLTQNLYTYVGNNPIKYVDPSGHCFWDACILEGAAAAALVEGALFVIGAASVMIWHNSSAAPVEVPRTDVSKPKLKVIQGGKNDNNSQQTKPMAPPVTKPNNNDDKNKERILLYHYTDKQGYDGILSSRQINPSLKALRPTDARYGDGVYLTDIAPNTMSYQELSKKMYNNVNQTNKTTYYFAIDITDLVIKYGRDNVYVYLTQTPLDISDRLVNAGYNRGTTSPNIRP
ncbi:RHS repeat-associated core domain-containing protein [Paenibacillus odorifer]|uniref:RHS repeat-associated core domain-containing protein n=1 Tax=Paenibacillus odorifer TaxID=189426 RepID=UPI00146FFD3C|nr:RHS repeat-associated core domain-containing protein [Paenibacillus odorifer]